MKFFYRPYEVLSHPGRPAVSIINRPVIPIHVSGPTGSATVFGLLDTGADATLLPADLMPILGIDPDTTETAHFQGVDSQLVTAHYSHVDLEIRRGNRFHQWSADIGFLTGRTVAILGHDGFLEHFKATFNSQLHHVTLTPNQPTQ